MTFTETEAGDSVITRSGTDIYGTAFDDRMVIKDTGLAEINRADVDLVNAPYFVDVSNPARVTLLGATESRALLDDITDTTSADVLPDTRDDMEVFFSMDNGYVGALRGGFFGGGQVLVYSTMPADATVESLAILSTFNYDPLTIESLAEFDVLLTTAV